MSIIARLMMSAAEPWQMVLIAWRPSRDQYSRRAFTGGAGGEAWGEAWGEAGERRKRDGERRGREKGER